MKRNILILLILISVNIGHASEWFQKSSRGGHKGTILKTGRELNEARTELIKNAKRTIFLTSFIFTAHEDQIETYQLLCDKAQLDHVDVRLLIDNLGSGQGGPELPEKAPNGQMSIAKLRSCGVKFQKFRPIGLINMLYVKHDKLLVVDGEKFIMGGSNFGKEYSGHGRTEFQWYDQDIMVAGPMACYYHNIFIQSWKRMYNIEYIQLKRRIVPRAARLNHSRRLKRWIENLKKNYDLQSLQTCTKGKVFGNSRFLSVFNNPYFSDERPILKVYENLFKDIEKSNLISDKKLLLYAPYFIPHERWEKKIIKLARDGYDIHIITNSLDSIDKSASVAYTGMLMSVGALLRNNVKIHLWNPQVSDFTKSSWPYSKSNVFHKKGGIYGASYAVFGSDNLDVRGQEYSSETISVTNDKDIIEEYTRNYFEDLRYTTRLTEKEMYRLLSQESLLKKFFAWVSMPFL